MVGPDLFPVDPPPGLRVVLSARYLANDRDAYSWLERLGWARPGLARTLQLYPLDRIGIASVLLEMDFPLDLLGTRGNIVSELHRLREGDPLLVRLYVDDLWERGEAAVRLQPEDLRVIRPGLVGYFERWWKDQRLLWSKEATRREAAAQKLLNLLAGALGPLSKQDILSLAPDEAGYGAGELEQHLLSLSRFVIGDGMRQGYVFSHLRLENYFLEERLGTAERQEVERRFLTWGEKTLAVLNSDILQEALDKVMAIKDEYDRLDALVELAPGLSEELLWQVLGALAPRIRDTLLSEALDIVQAMKDREQRAQVLEVLVSSLPEARKGERAQQIGKPSRRSGTKEGTRGLRHAIPPISPWGNDEFGPTTVLVGMGKRGQCLDP